MKSIFANRALLPDGWADNVRVGIDAAGMIASVERNTDPQEKDLTLGSGVLLPAPSNLHSHTFQRAMAGMTEHRSAKKDDFWTWRTLMYRFLEVLEPDEIEAIAALVYLEMLESGYAAVAEFHYVHHQPGGGSYDNIAELSERIFAAAETTGIGLTHLPVLYSYGGADRAPLTGGQKRFGCDLERFAQLHAAARAAMAGLPQDFAIGIAPHSLRATAPDQYDDITVLGGNGPIHIHAAEQQKEVQDIEAWLGARPVQWLLDHADISANWCLIHTTHMTERETRALAKSGATAGLCPITEANLGDGVFNGPTYLVAGGCLGVGSDSNIRVSLSEELRQLEYSQRLRHEARNVMATQEASTGALLYDKVLNGGARALQRNSGALETGKLADMVVLDADQVALCGLRPEQYLDGWIFASDDRLVRDVWSAGRHCVSDGRHKARDAVERCYSMTLKGLMDRI
ncbi:MAG: formimidoylglutamate deiminase [Alphaproteobacteria bacterium]|nr:formimidoylglutamate deiminase [Alphaproteobacteria bacterium]